MKTYTKITDLNLSDKIESTWSKDEVLLFDIETTGLKKETTQVYLIGCGYFNGANWTIKQFLSECALDEEELLMEFLRFASGFKALVHFNGDSFDIPYILYKADYYGIKTDFCKMESFDIYKKTKHLKKLLKMESMSQTSIEKFLHICRDDKLDGGRLIPVYYDYEKTGSPDLEKLLLLHNFDDIQGMFKISSFLDYTDIQAGNFSFDSYEIKDNTLIINFTMPGMLLAEFENQITNDFEIYGYKQLLQINIKIYTGEASHLIKDYKNYYYLPAEEKVIHKSVADFVDKSRKVKATKNNCCIKKYGRFIPQKNNMFEPDFKVCDNKNCYFEFTEELFEDEAELKKYILEFINF